MNTQDPTTTAELLQEAYQRGLGKRYERLIDYAPDMTLKAEANLLDGDFIQEFMDSWDESYAVMRLALYVVRKSLLPANYATDQKIRDEALLTTELNTWLEDEEKRLVAEWIEEQP